MLEPEDRHAAFEAAQRSWLADQFAGLTVEREIKRPSEWAEETRYLPPSVSPMPGFYRFDVAPFLREIVDCFSIDSPVREVAVMKGVQICATTGIVENVLGYAIDHVKTAPVMIVTADLELAKQRMSGNVIPMLQHSDLMRLIKSADETNNRKQGKTDTRLEWVGGGFLVPFGAQNANKLRALSIQFLLGDEVDGWPDTVGKDGDPVKLATDRTAAYEQSRKIGWFSTPLIKGQSKIASLFEKGDQRYYHVRCLRCEHPQALRWTRVDNETGVITGMTWEMDGNRLVPGSVRYLCEHCGHPHAESDKPKLFAEDNAEWVPTAVPTAPNVRSYHVSALYSPVGMQSWETCVQKWLGAMDVATGRPKDLDQLQVFYNNVLGSPFEIRGERVKFEQVSPHRRDYRYGEVPNKFAVQHCGSPVLLVTCAVDVHKHFLKVATFGWCADRRAFLLDYHTLEGPTESIDEPSTWGELQKIIEHRVYTADDGRKYRVQMTLVDSGYLPDTVTRFCGQYELGVYPIRGAALSPKAVRAPTFSEGRTKSGSVFYGITVDLYKDRWSAALRRGWDGLGLQPAGHFNAPIDCTDKQLRELTAEVKSAKVDKTGKRVGFEWHRPSGAANELWDLLVYNNGALDLIAWNMSTVAKLPSTNWPWFWDLCLEGQFMTAD